MQLQACARAAGEVNKTKGKNAQPFHTRQNYDGIPRKTMTMQMILVSPDGAAYLLSLAPYLLPLASYLLPLTPYLILTPVYSHASVLSSGKPIHRSREIPRG
jgi:hypothetical protein